MDGRAAQEVSSPLLPPWRGRALSRGPGTAVSGGGQSLGPLWLPEWTVYLAWSRCHEETGVSAAEGPRGQ